MYRMPASAMSSTLPASSAMTVGCQSQMMGNSARPANAVKISRTATLLCLKYRSTRYLSKWVEIAQRTGPQNANTSQVIEIWSPIGARFDCVESDREGAAEYGAPALRRYTYQ